MLHAVAYLFKQLITGSQMWLSLLQEVNTFLKNLASYLMPLVLILHELVFKQRGQVLEAVTLDTWQVKYRSVVNAPHCGCAPASQEVGDFTEYSASLNLADIILAASKVCAGDSALTLR